MAEHYLTKYGTTTCPVERVRAERDEDGTCSACGGDEFVEESETARTITGPITIHSISPPANARRLHPCETGNHRWAYLASGGQACGYCGRRR